MKKKDFVPAPDSGTGDLKQVKKEKVHAGSLPTYVNWRKVIQLPVRE